MIKDNTVAAQKDFDKAVRFMDNAKKELKLARKNGEEFQDVKHMQVACGTAYLAVLKAVDGIFILRNIPKPKKKGSIEYYQDGLSRIDKKMLSSLNMAYQILHLDGYYNGYNDAITILRGFEKADFIILKLKQAL